MNNSPSGNRVKPSIQTLAKASTIISSPHFSAGGESSSHFDSLVKNLSDWNPSIQQNENDDINEEIVDFELGSDELWQLLENLPPLFKLPNLDAFENKVKTTPKSSKKVLFHHESSPILSQSPLVAQPKRSRRAIFSSSDEDDTTGKSVTKIRKLSKNKADSKPKRKNMFIDDEADLSGSASSDEDDAKDLEAFEASFVDDATQRPSIDQKAMYLRSIKSPTRGSNINDRKRKNVPSLQDVCSQPVTDTMLMDDYEEDSFCVDNSEVEYASSTDELEFVPEFKDKPSKAVKPTSKVENANIGGGSRLSSKGKRKRILVESSDDETEEVIKLPPEKVVKTPPTPLSETKSENNSDVGSEHDKSNISTISNLTSGLSILANPSEIHRSQELISCLKHDHNMNVNSQCRFEGAGFLASTRFVLRIMCFIDLLYYICFSYPTD